MAWVGLRVAAVSMLILRVTPYTGGAFLNWAHMTIGVVGSLVQLAISWSLVRRHWMTASLAELVVQLVGRVWGLLSLPNW